ncbi:hypothetical protein SAY87_015341 [Trapa incisa]|uniref:Uncharacterized protein n=1 Tax=Trapa incisa TaxID=236973 RepID=A0AAN7GZ47_9MYRT|nr:hypothetical protein SAY87_015341 [Trapa incisa]
MMSRDSGLGRKTTAAVSSAMDEVEQLLQAAQDDVLLKLSVNSHHISRGSSDSLDPDLSRRFQALKARPSAPNPPPPHRPSPYPRGNDELKDVLGDDLSARFAALRGSANHSSSSSPLVVSSLNQAISEPSVSRGLIEQGCGSANPDNDEDEVEKIIQWAKDAARLDPSPPSDEEDNKDDDDDGDDDMGTGSSSDDDRGEAKGAKKGPRQRRNP